MRPTAVEPPSACSRRASIQTDAFIAGRKRSTWHASFRSHGGSTGSCASLPRRCGSPAAGHAPLSGATFEASTECGDTSRGSTLFAAGRSIDCADEGLQSRDRSFRGFVTRPNPASNRRRKPSPAFQASFRRNTRPL